MSNGATAICVPAINEYRTIRGETVPGILRQIPLLDAKSAPDSFQPAGRLA